MCEVRLWGVKFFDPLGRVRKTYLVPKGWECRIIGSSENFVVLATQAPDKTREVSVLDKDGRVFWKQQVTKPGTGAVVSDRGELLHLYKGWGQERPEVVIFDEKGAPRDTVFLNPVGFVAPMNMKATGRLAFVSTGPIVGREPGRFLCYDFENMQVKFLVEDDHSFGNFDVDEEAGLVAVTVHLPDRKHLIRIYGLEGHYKTEVEIESDGGYTTNLWFKLLGDALLLAEKNQLKLYAINER